jgi:hypothetical protein
MMTAFLDESGTHGNSSRVTVMAGYLGDESHWLLFEAAWKAFLAKYPTVIGTHATDVLNRRGKYYKWPDAIYQEFISDMVGVVIDAGLKTILVALTNREYREFKKLEREQGRRDKIDSAYGLCFRLCMVKLALYARRSRPDERISFVVESGHKNVGDAERIFRITKNTDIRIRRYHNLGNFAEASKFDYGALQAADLIAYCGYRHMDRFLESGQKQRLSADPVFNRLLWHDLSYETYWITAEYLMSASDGLVELRNAISSKR